MGLMKAEKIHYSKSTEAVSISILYSKEAIVFPYELRKMTIIRSGRLDPSGCFFARAFKLPACLANLNS